MRKEERNFFVYLLISYNKTMIKIFIFFFYLVCVVSQRCCAVRQLAGVRKCRQAGPHASYPNTAGQIGSRPQHLALAHTHGCRTLYLGGSALVYYNLILHLSTDWSGLEITSKDLDFC